ncbi:MAG: bifunctional metallophosphatase/5'-nucleotidase [Elusimicrobia bacterium]|nr:bifunctional metallophosphatase/5'-nucleotidase [Elusimicrobiota bacterium]
MRRATAVFAALIVAAAAVRRSGAESDLSQAYEQGRVGPVVLSVPPADADPTTFVIYHTNDIHGQLAPRPANPALRQNATGGIASLSTLLKRETRKWFWIDSGDWAQGTPLGSLSKGKAIIPFFNRLGLSAAVIGNHDFDWGEANLYELLEEAKFTFLGHNILGADGLISAADIRERDIMMNMPQFLQPMPGFRIGLLGLLSPDTPKMLAAGRMDYLTVEPVLGHARTMSSILRKAGADMVIAVTHLGIEKAGERVFKLSHEGDIALAEAVPGIDMILGGHVHVNVTDPYVRTSDGRTVVVTQTDGMLRNVYRIEITVDRRTKRLLEAKATLLALDPAAYPPDPEILAELAKAEEDLGPEIQRVVGRASDDLRHEGPSGEITGVTAMGSLVTDSMRAAGGVEIALAGSFGVRSTLKAGEITYKDVFMVAPFENSVLTFKIKGSDLRAYLRGCEVPGAYRCQYSGIEAVHGPGPDGGRALLSASVNGEPLDDDRLYSGAIDSFNAQFLPLRDKVTLRDIDRDILAGYISRHSPLRPASPRSIRR